MSKLRFNFSVKNVSPRWLYWAYLVFVGVPFLVGLVPPSWGRVRDWADAFLSFTPLGLIATLLLVVTPFLLLWFYKKDKKREYLVTGIVTLVLFIVFAWAFVRLARQLGSF